MMKHIMKQIIFFFVFLTLVLGVFFYSRGYKYNPKNQTITPTGMVSVNTYPRGSKIYIDNELKGSGDLTLSLSVGNHIITVSKEGYTSVTNTVYIIPEIVFPLDVMLIPINPSLTPVTSIGVQYAKKIQNATSILLFTDKTTYATNEAAYTINTGNSLLDFGKSLRPVIDKGIFTGTNPEDFNVITSPDGDQIVLDSKQKSILIDLDKLNTNLTLLDSSKKTLFKAWEDKKSSDEARVFETMPKFFTNTNAELISLSPDKTKVLYKVKQNGFIDRKIDPPLTKSTLNEETRTVKANLLYVYDKKDDKNFAISIPASAQNVQWYIDSNRIMYSEKSGLQDIVRIMFYDNSQIQTAYSGPFLHNFFTMSSDGNILVLINLNPYGNRLEDIYKIGIR